LSENDAQVTRNEFPRTCEIMSRPRIFTRGAPLFPPRNSARWRPKIFGLPSASSFATNLIHLRATNAPLNFACGSKKQIQLAR
jgi:hypothetical protein